MKKNILTILISLVVLTSCEKEDDLLVPVQPNPTTNVTVVDTTNDIDVLTEDTTTTNTLQEYELVNCSFNYDDFNDDNNDIGYEGQPYNEFGNINTLTVGDSIMVNMPIYPTSNTVQTTPLFLPNGTPEWFKFTINSITKTSGGYDLNLDMKRIICSQTIQGLNLHFDVVEFGDMMELSISDQGNGWSTYQTITFKKR